MTSTQVRFRVHFDPDTTLGPGKIDLLEQIALTGSLSSAARAMDMSYRRGWVLLHALNTRYDEPAAVTAKGGRHGGGATLTPFGRELIRVYRRFDARLQKQAARAFGPIARQVVRGRGKGRGRVKRKAAAAKA
jgi:molybdate transport system regulatory protein